MHRIGCIILIWIHCSIGLGQEDSLTSFADRLDPAMPLLEAGLLLSDLDNLKQQQIVDLTAGPFARIYGVKGAGGVFNFLQTHTSYILPAEIPNFVVAMDDSNVAINLGASLWYFQISNPRTHVMLGRLPLIITSPRAGLIQLGRQYKTQFSTGLPITPAVRMAYLLHEARHSDCAEALSEQQLNQLSVSGSLLAQYCGYPHTMCPIDHDYGGLPACDEQPWGAYAFSGAYLAAVSLHCASCSQLEKQQALILAADHYDRILPLSVTAGGVESENALPINTSPEESLVAGYEHILGRYLPQYFDSQRSEEEWTKILRSFRLFREERMRRSAEQLAPILALPVEE